MKKQRFLAAVLAFCLVLTLLPGDLRVLAAEGDVFEVHADTVIPKKDGEHTSVFIAKGVTDAILKASIHNPFAEFYALASFEVEEGNPDYVSVDGVLFSRDMTRLCAYPATRPETSYTIPGAVRVLVGDSFSYAEQLRELWVHADSREAIDAARSSGQGMELPTWLYDIDIDGSYVSITLHDYIDVTGVSLTDAGGDSVDNTTLSIEVGGAVELRAVLSPSAPTAGGVSWSVVGEDTGVVALTESADGMSVSVLGKKMGAVTVRATALDHGPTGEDTFFADCTVSVGTVTVGSVGSNLPEGSTAVTLGAGEHSDLSVKLDPVNPTNPNVIWRSDDPGVVTVSAPPAPGSGSGGATGSGGAEPGAEVIVPAGSDGVSSVVIAQAALPRSAP